MCNNCILGRKYHYNSKAHINLNQIETTLKVITNEPTTDCNNK